MFLCGHNYRCIISMMGHPHISLGTSYSTWISNSLTNGLIMVSAESWPPWSPDLSPLDFHVWGLHGKHDVWMQSGHEIDKQLQWISMRDIYDATVLHEVTLFIVEWGRMCIQALQWPLRTLNWNVLWFLWTAITKPIDKMYIHVFPIGVLVCLWTCQCLIIHATFQIPVSP